MKRKMFKTSILALLMIGVLIQASVVSATGAIRLADTPPYNEESGKIVLLYADGTQIKNIDIYWHDIDNPTHDELHHVTNITGSNASSYMYVINQVWNASFIHYQISVLTTPPLSETFNYEGVFSTSEIIDLDIEDMTNYSKIENLTIKQIVNLQSWLLTNSSYKKLFSNLQSNLQTYISDKNDGLVQAIRNEGLSNSQISDLEETIATGFESTLRDSKDQSLAEAESYDQGRSDIIVLIGVFVAFVIFVIILYYLTKGTLFEKLSNLRGGRKQAPGQPSSFSASSSEPDFSDIFS